MLLIVSIGIIVISQERNQSSSSPPINPTPELLKQFVVTTVTASPSNTTPGLVTVIAEVQNQGSQSEKGLVVMRIQEPNGNTMSIPNNSSTIEIPAGGFKTVTFLPMIPLNSKIGKFNVDIDVYDLNQTTKYFSTGFIYPFTTPLDYHIWFWTEPDLPYYEVTVDGTIYHEQDLDFYWYLGTNHTVSVPNEIGNYKLLRYQLYPGDSIVINGNILDISVTATSCTAIRIEYVPK